ncbi:MAG TPA: hypothetical protein VMD97_02410 [Candidatus Aquilonibacter sp.]|nr:hypothetical protein [Candidatus Aquilonibacter sp.]
MPAASPRPAFRQPAWPAGAALAVPLAAFLGLTLRYIVNIPTLDDYDCGLEFLLTLIHQPNARSKLLLLLSTQHNEYKSIFESAVFWLQYAAFGKLNFRLSMIIGDLFPLIVGIVLWKLFTPRIPSFGLKLALFVPAALLFFQLNYAEALNAPMTALQHMPAVAFAFIAILLLHDDRSGAFAGAIAAFLIGVSASTNVFLVVPIGIAILISRKRYARSAIWIGVFLLALLIYRFHYHSPPSHVAYKHSSFLVALLVLKPLYTLAVLGAAAWQFRFPGACVLGAALVLFNLYLIRSGYFRRRPAIGYCELFLLLTAMGIAQVRLDFGLTLSISSRYRIYSDLLLVFAWFSIADQFVLDADGTLRVPLRRNWIFITAMSFAVLNAAVCDYTGNKFFRTRYRYWTEGVAAYEHPQFPGSTEGPLLPVTGQDQDRQQAAIYCRKIFAQAVAAGIYAPPQYPAPAYPIVPQRP